MSYKVSLLEGDKDMTLAEIVMVMLALILLVHFSKFQTPQMMVSDLKLGL